MEIHHLTDDLVSARRALLQESLRPGFADYSIELEYPIVLHPTNHHYSLGVSIAAGGEGRTLLAHANLWPRVLIHPASKRRFPIGLVGNVATAPSSRGQGIMTLLLNNLWEKAENAGLEALLLWSDLVAFYHKLGFVSCGQERRYYFSTAQLQIPSFPYKILAAHGDELSDKVLAEMLALRYQTPAYLERSIEEFRTLLKIPDTVVLLARQRDSIIGFGVLGKGCDMVGIIHEWGAHRGEALLAILRHVGLKTQWQELGLLAPHNLADSWQQQFRPYLLREELHPMTLLRAQGGSAVGEVLAEGFLWGFDSI